MREGAAFTERFEGDWPGGRGARHRGGGSVAICARPGAEVRSAAASLASVLSASTATWATTAPVCNWSRKARCSLRPARLPREQCGARGRQTAAGEKRHGMAVPGRCEPGRRPVLFEGAVPSPRCGRRQVHREHRVAGEPARVSGRHRKQREQVRAPQPHRGR